MNFNFDFKSLINLDTTYGKKLVTIVYYLMTVVIVVNTVVSFIAGIASIANGFIINGLGNILFCVPLAIVYFLILRVVCELVNAIFEHCGK
ncbi:MAG: DUF4282 domain-containing protein [Clostridiales bacterium]|nr:DUF4282 domain-containing protein [Clostridiales bacterium]